MVKISAWGTGAGLRLTKKVMAEAGFSIDQQVDLVSVEGGILVTPARPVYDITSLVSRMTDKNRPEFVDFGSVGNEIIDD